MKAIYPNKWGKGALFAYSGLDGINTMKHSMCGQLLGERIGMTFDTNAIDLYLRLQRVYNFEFTIVASDIILGTLSSGEAFGFLFVEQDTVVGFCPKETAKICCHGDFLTHEEYEDCQCYYKEEVTYVFATCENEDNIVFALSRGANKQEVCHKVNKALGTDIKASIDAKLLFYNGVPVLEHANTMENMTLAKCFSVMKSQVYTAEGRFKQRWTTPDRLPHKMLWLWDSVFHSIGNVYLEPQLAYESILSILDSQSEDGFIPHMATPEDQSDITQPPIIAWGLYKLYEKTGNKEWLENCYEGLEKYLAWNMKNRDSNENLLFEWEIDQNQSHCRCAESGMDNSPRFDDVKPMDAIDFSCFMANEMRCMKRIADILGKKQEAEIYEKLYTSMKLAINTYLYDSADGRYYDREIKSGKLRKVSAVSSFLPLFSGVCTEETAAALIKDLLNEETFGTRFGVPSISKEDKTFGEDMWRGPVWINYNYFIIQGLKEYGYVDLADKLREETISVLTEWYIKEGSLFEFYDCNNEVSPCELSRKGPALQPADYSVRPMAIADYGWTCTVFVDLIMTRESERKQG